MKFWEWRFSKSQILFFDFPQNRLQNFTTHSQCVFGASFWIQDFLWISTFRERVWFKSSKKNSDAVETIKRYSDAENLKCFHLRERKLRHFENCIFRWWSSGKTSDFCWNIPKNCQGSTTTCTPVVFSLFFNKSTISQSQNQLGTFLRSPCLLERVGKH